MTSPEVQPALFVKMAIDAWNTQIGRVSKLLLTIPNERLTKEIAPGRNSGLYILGHLAAVHDAMMPLLGFGAQARRDMEDLFVTKPDKSGINKPPVQEVRAYWNEVNKALTSHFGKMTIADWFTRHSAITEADFQMEPHRNKLNVLLNRTSHVAYHHGQLILLTKIAE